MEEPEPLEEPGEDRAGTLQEWTNRMDALLEREGKPQLKEAFHNLEAKHFSLEEKQSWKILRTEPDAEKIGR